jgi:hypothetical protein
MVQEGPTLLKRARPRDNLKAKMKAHLSITLVQEEPTLAKRAKLRDNIMAKKQAHQSASLKQPLK